MNEKIKKYLIYIILFSIFFGLTYLFIPSIAFAFMIALILIVFVK